MTNACEAKIEVPVEDEWGNKLPSEWRDCRHPVKYLVLRLFSGKESALCGVHARRYVKAVERHGASGYQSPHDVREVSKVGA